MNWWVSIRFWLRARTRREALRSEIDEELDYHIWMRARELIAEGWEKKEAYRSARERFGGFEPARRACRTLYMVDGENGGDGMMRELGRDVRHTLRALRRQPAFAAAVILTLGLGIGANSAIFSVLNGVLFEPLPYEQPENLVRLWQADRINGTRFEGFSVPDFFDVLERSSVFEAMAAIENRPMTMTGPEDDPQQLRAVAASHSLMALMGVPPALGRSFLPEEDVPDGERVAMLGYGLWQSRFGGDEGVIGRSVRLDGVSFDVVGVAARDFDFPSAGVQPWIPLGEGPRTRARNTHNFGVIARIHDGITLAQASSNLTAIASALEEECSGENEGREFWAQPLHDSVVGSARSALYLLGAAVVLVLMIACVNVANLLFARANSREREVAIRLAMGAGRARLLRQFLTEYVVMAGVGGIVGLAVAFAGVRALLSMSPTTLPRQANIGIDGAALAFTVVASLVAGLACGLLPALRASRVDLRSPLSDGGARGSAPGLGSVRLRNGLVVLEVAMTVVLVTSAGLLIKSFSRLQAVDPGFDPQGLLAVDIQLPPSRYPQSRGNWPNYPEVLGFQRDLRVRAAALPGVPDAAIAMIVPTDAGWTTRFGIEGRSDSEVGATEEVRIRNVSSGYTETIGLEVVRGRTLTERDDPADAPPVILINEAMARRYFADEDPIGQRIENWGTLREVVGIVRDVSFMGLGQPVQPAVYPTFSRMPFSGFSLLLRTTGDPAAVIPFLRAQIREMDSDLAPGAIRSLDSDLRTSTGQNRFNALLLSLFAGVALMLAAVGIYGVISYGVSQRTHEIGVRLSLGASAGEVARQIVGQGLRLTALGIVLGLVGTVGATKMLTSLLFGVEAFDPANILTVVILATGVTVAASYLPARRASRVDPMTAVRGD